MMDRRHRRTGEPTDDEEEDGPSSSSSPAYRRSSHRRRSDDDCIRIDQGDESDHDIVSANPVAVAEALNGSGENDGVDDADYFYNSDQEPDDGEEDLEDVEEEDEEGPDGVVVLTVAGTEGQQLEDEQQFDEDLPYPGFVPITLGFLTQTSRPRALCLRMITNPYPFSHDSVSEQGIVCASAKRPVSLRNHLLGVLTCVFVCVLVRPREIEHEEKSLRVCVFVLTYEGEAGE